MPAAYALFDEKQYEAEMTKLTGKTQEQRRAEIEQAIERNIARWNARRQMAKKK